MLCEVKKMYVHYYHSKYNLQKLIKKTIEYKNTKCDIKMNLWINLNQEIFQN